VRAGRECIVVICCMLTFFFIVSQFFKVSEKYEKTHRCFCCIGLLLKKFNEVNEKKLRPLWQCIFGPEIHTDEIQKC